EGRRGQGGVHLQRRRPRRGLPGSRQPGYFLHGGCAAGGRCHPDRPGRVGCAEDGQRRRAELQALHQPAQRDGSADPDQGRAGRPPAEFLTAGQHRQSPAMVGDFFVCGLANRQHDYSAPGRWGNIVPFSDRLLSQQGVPMTSLSADPTLAQRLDGIGEVEFVIPDMNGIPRGKVIHARNVINGRRVQMAHGVLTQCLTGEYHDPRYYGYDDSDFILRPIPGQLHRTPWSATPRALALCEAVEMDGTPARLSSRSMLRQVVERYEARGWSPKVATEMEFYLFEHNADVLQPFRPPVGLDGRREVGSQAFAVGSVTGLQPFFTELKSSMAAVGIPCEAVMHEMGLSQYEVNFTHDDPLLIADQTFLFKYLLHEVALKHGLIAVCMAKPLSRMPGSSMHIHQSVVDQAGRTVFTAANQEASAEFRHYLGGLQAHLGDLILLLAPNINSYQRYCHVYASPNNLCWSNDNRRTGLRVPASEPDA